MSGEREAVVNAAAEHRRKEDFEYWSDEEVADFSLAENAKLRKELESTAEFLDCSPELCSEAALSLQKALVAAEAEVVKLREALQQAQNDFDEIYVLPLNSLRIKLVATLASDRIESALNPGAAKEGNDALE